MTLKIVAVRLTPAEYQAARDLIQLGRARTMSCLLRQGLMAIFADNNLKFEARLKIRQERLLHPTRKAKEKPDGQGQENEATEGSGGG